MQFQLKVADCVVAKSPPIAFCNVLRALEKPFVMIYKTNDFLSDDLNNYQSLLSNQS